MFKEKNIYGEEILKNDEKEPPISIFLKMKIMISNLRKLEWKRVNVLLKHEFLVGF